MKLQKMLSTAICAGVLTVGTTPLVAQTQTLSIRDVYDVLEKQGYRNVTEIELERQRLRGGQEYQVKADNASGDYVKLRVDAATGEIVSERRRRK